MRDTTMKLKTLNKVLNIYLKDNLLNHCKMFKGAIVLVFFFFYLRSMCSEIYSPFKKSLKIQSDNQDRQ